MIDQFKRIALAIRVLRVPAIIVGLVCATAIIVLLMTSDSRQDDRLLMPSFVGLLWAIGLFTFIESFRAVPERAGSDQTLYGRLKRSMRRGWYWVLVVVFVGATAVAMFLTGRLVSIWLNEYAP